MRGLRHYILVPLMFIGALNWGLIGIFGFDLVAYLFGPATLLTNIVYSLVGIAAVAWLIIIFLMGCGFLFIIQPLAQYFKFPEKDIVEYLKNDLKYIKSQM
jgi:uncharacterized membrane protein YuzA (DUF378 family)